MMSSDLVKRLQQLKLFVMRLIVNDVGEIEVGWVPKTNQVDPDYDSCDEGQGALTRQQIEQKLRDLVGQLFGH